MANCFNHEDRAAAARCAVCGKGICEECAVNAGGMTFCSEACRDKGAAVAGQANDVLERKAKTNSATAVRKLIYIFVVILAVAAAYYFYSQNQKSIDRKIQKSLNKVEKQTSSTIKSAKKTIPTSSQIKRDKEALVK